VVGDVGVHEKCGEEFWKKLVHDMRSHFKKPGFQSRYHPRHQRNRKIIGSPFSRTGDTINELPDEIAQG